MKGIGPTCLACLLSPFPTTPIRTFPTLHPSKRIQHAVENTSASKALSMGIKKAGGRSHPNFRRSKTWFFKAFKELHLYSWKYSGVLVFSQSLGYALLLCSHDKCLQISVWEFLTRKSGVEGSYQDGFSPADVVALVMVVVLVPLETIPIWKSELKAGKSLILCGLGKRMKTMFRFAFPSLDCISSHIEGIHSTSSSQLRRWFDHIPRPKKSLNSRQVSHRLYFHRSLEMYSVAAQLLSRHDKHKRLSENSLE